MIFFSRHRFYFYHSVVLSGKFWWPFYAPSSSHSVFAHYLLHIYTLASLSSLTQCSPLHTYTCCSAALEQLYVAEWRSGALRLTLTTAGTNRPTPFTLRMRQLNHGLVAALALSVSVRYGMFCVILCFWVHALFSWLQGMNTLKHENLKHTHVHWQTIHTSRLITQQLIYRLWEIETRNITPKYWCHMAKKHHDWQHYVPLHQNC